MSSAHLNPADYTENKGKLLTYFQARLEELRDELEQGQEERETAAVRGKIEEVRFILRQLDPSNKYRPEFSGEEFPIEDEGPRKLHAGY